MLPGKNVTQHEATRRNEAVNRVRRTVGLPDRDYDHDSAAQHPNGETVIQTISRFAKVSLIAVVALGVLLFVPEFVKSGSPYVCPSAIAVSGIPLWSIAAFLVSALYSSMRRKINPNAPPGRLIPTVPFYGVLIAVTVAVFAVSLPFEPFASTFGICGPTGIFGF